MHAPSPFPGHHHMPAPIGLIADWRDFVFLHFAVDPAALAPHVPYPLDLHEGRAFVSLVSFRMERLRPARGLPPAFGRWLLRPVSDHQFLNVRTYVRGPAGTGIHFITEWIDRPASRWFASLTYGLPYRLAALERRDQAGAGLRRITVHDAATDRASHLVVPTAVDAPPAEAIAGSAAAFLLERYLAYTHRRGIGRWFAVAHPHWQVRPFQLARFDFTLFEAEYPWFSHAHFTGGHLAAGFADVAMSLPRAIRTVASERVTDGAPVAAAGR